MCWFFLYWKTQKAISLKPPRQIMTFHGGHWPLGKSLYAYAKIFSTPFRFLSTLFHSFFSFFPTPFSVLFYSFPLFLFLFCFSNIQLKKNKLFCPHSLNTYTTEMPCILSLLLVYHMAIKMLFLNLSHVNSKPSKYFLHNFFTCNSSYNLAPPISWVLIGRHLIFFPLTLRTFCNSPRKCTPVKYKARQKAGSPIVT